MPAPPVSHKKILDEIGRLKFDFSPAAITILENLLKKIPETVFTNPQHWKRYYHELLFLLAYPGSGIIYALAQTEIRRVSRFLFANRPVADALVQSGLPGTCISGCFSHALNKALLKEDPDNIKPDTAGGNKELAMQWLAGSLTGLEKEMLSEETVSWKEWLIQFAGSSPSSQLSFLLQQAETAGRDITSREACFGALGLFTTIRMNDDIGRFGRTAGKLVHPYIHEDGLTKKGNTEWLNDMHISFKELPISFRSQQSLIRYARNAIISFFKETDPFTYAQVHETAYYDCGRGIRIALFYMVPEKKLMLETYAGYLLLKNNVPVAYGGGWVLGTQCRFGLNILPWFRGGESVFICQTLLLLYKKVFGVSTFIIDPFQIGKHNPEGIASAAFWFYYRMGFRPLQAELAALAGKEYKKILRNKKYRCPAAVLKQLSESCLRLQARPEEPAPYYDIIRLSKAVTGYIRNEFGNDRKSAERSCRAAQQQWRKKLPSAILLMNAMVAADKKLSPQALQSLANTFSLKAREEKKFTRDLQQHTAFFTLLLACQEKGLQ